MGHSSFIQKSQGLDTARVRPQVRKHWGKVTRFPVEYDASSEKEDRQLVLATTFKPTKSC